METCGAQDLLPLKLNGMPKWFFCVDIPRQNELTWLSLARTTPPLYTFNTNMSVYQSHVDQTNSAPEATFPTLLGFNSHKFHLFCFWHPYGGMLRVLLFMCLLVLALKLELYRCFCWKNTAIFLFLCHLAVLEVCRNFLPTPKWWHSINKNKKKPKKTMKKEKTSCR